MSQSAKRRALAAMWAGTGFSALVLASSHPLAAAAMMTLSALGTLTVLFGVRTIEESVTTAVDRWR